MGLPTFDVAVNKMIQMLGGLHHPTSIVWSFREDYACSRRNRCLYTYIDTCETPRTIEQNRLLTNYIYDSAVPNIGVEVTLVAVARNRSFCSIWKPSSELDAEYRMIFGPKFRIPNNLPLLRVIEDERSWKILIERESNEEEMILEGLMSREEAP